MFSLPVSLLTTTLLLSSANAAVSPLKRGESADGRLTSSTVFPSALASSTSSTSGTSGSDSDTSSSSSFNYGVDKVRGVSLGGWLVLEPFITPSVFAATGNDAIVDEWTFGEYQDKDTAAAALQQHWDTWFTEQDFKDIAAAGLNHVRCPIGYWAFDVSEGEPYIQGQLPYLQKALAWAEGAGLKLIVDIHGAPGSQNGNDNSGQRMTTVNGSNYATWQLNQDNVDRTGKVLQQLADILALNSSTATAIQPINEPAGYNGTQMLDVVREYYDSAYNIIRSPNGQDDSNLIVLFHDAFENGDYWGDYMTPAANGTHDVVMDTHQYQVFTVDVLNQTLDEHIQSACNLNGTIKDYELPVVVGEWSLPPTDCAYSLNGRGLGPRWNGEFPLSPYNNSCDGFSDASTFSDDYKVFLRKFYEAQIDAYETSYGWIFWTWKTEPGTADEWSYSLGLQNGWIPQDPTNRMYPDICTSTASASLSKSSSSWSTTSTSTLLLF